MNSLHFPTLLFAFSLLISSPDVNFAEESAELDVEVTLDLSDDRGQNLGTLFEVQDAQGKVIAGAGFLGAYNTQPRSERYRLHFFLKPKEFRYSVKSLPRVNKHHGVYLSEQKGKLLAKTRNGSDGAFYAYDSQANSWNVDDSTKAYDIEVAGKLLQFRNHHVEYDGEEIFTADKATRIGENYYANGYLVMRVFQIDEGSRKNRLLTVPWKPGKTGANLNSPEVSTHPLRSDGEFVYAIGQLDREILLATNTGGVYSFNGRGWRVIVEPAAHSYQVYSMVNYMDGLLLGHYPSGELFEYKNGSLEQLKGWPPVMEGVSIRAREAQTMVIYGGELYVGVWPWGEVWRYDRNNSSWSLVQRMFDHPASTDATTHPYENETKAISEVANLWGQRVTSMVPFEESLFISTSSKTGISPAPDFLSQDKLEDYGRVYKLKIPGQISTRIDFQKQPTTIRLRIRDGVMSIFQNDQLKAEQKLDSSTMQIGFKQIDWKEGLFGKLTVPERGRSSRMSYHTSQQN